MERSKYDMSFNYFLDMTPEDEVINPSSLTKFRQSSKAAKLLRKSVYEIDEKMKDKFPLKTTTNELSDELDYCQKASLMKESK